MKKWIFVIGSFSSLVGFSQQIDVLNYQFSIELNDKNDSLIGVADVSFVQQSNSKTVFFDLAGINKEGKGMKVLYVNSGFERSIEHQFSHVNDKVTIQLPQARKGDTIWLSIAYRGIPDDGLIISRNKYGDKTFFADNWPNRAHHWIPCNDQPSDKASFSFKVLAPEEYSVISNGTKTVEAASSNGKRRTIWTESVSLPTKVMVIGVAKFATKVFEDSPSNIPVSAWVYQQDSIKGFHDYAPAAEILKFFSNYIAPYPYEKLANVQSKTIYGGMENASAIFYFEGSVTGKGGIEDLLAHEIAHQWFGDMASEKSFTHLWLSEGFATYFTDIYWQHTFGEEAFRRRLQKERDQVIQFAKSSDHPVVDSLSSYMDLLNANSYQKGAWVLHMLRNEVGDSVFHKIIQTYYQQYKGGNADTRDFEAVAERVSGKNLKWFFDQWLYQPGIPELDISYFIDNNEVKFAISQKQKSLFKIPLYVETTDADGKILLHRIFIDQKTTKTKIKIGKSVKSVKFDPNINLLFVNKVFQIPNIK